MRSRRRLVHSFDVLGRLICHEGLPTLPFGFGQLGLVAGRRVMMMQIQAPGSTVGAVSGRLRPQLVAKQKSATSRGCAREKLPARDVLHVASARTRTSARTAALWPARSLTNR